MKVRRTCFGQDVLWTLLSHFQRFSGSGFRHVCPKHVRPKHVICSFEVLRNVRRARCRRHCYFVALLYFSSCCSMLFQLACRCSQLAKTFGVLVKGRHRMACSCQSSNLHLHNLFTTLLQSRVPLTDHEPLLLLTRETLSKIFHPFLYLPF